jgi:hypothetical protein
VSIDVNRSHDCPCQTVSVKFDDGLSQKTRGRDSRYDLAGGAAPTCSLSREEARLKFISVTGPLSVLARYAGEAF